MAALAITSMGHLSTLPQVTQTLIVLSNDPTSSANDFHKVIGTDPALSARVLRVVNSSLYGLPGRVGSINRAVVMLGISAVRNITLGCSFAKVFQGKPLHPAFCPTKLWEHSQRVALASQVLARQMKSPLTDESFLAGLIHDIGMLVIAQNDPRGMCEVLDRTLDVNQKPISDMLAIESEMFGTDHTIVGRTLCEQWKFPANLAASAGGHHHPELLPPESRLLATIVYVAERVAEKAVPKFGADILSRQISEAALDTLRLTRAELAVIRDWILQSESQQNSSNAA